jgi:hypothetical protein
VRDFTLDVSVAKTLAVYRDTLAAARRRPADDLSPR